MTKRKMSTFERLESGRLNRKQRRELGRRVAAADPGLTIVHANAGGIDVGNESHYVAVLATSAAYWAVATTYCRNRACTEAFSMA